MKAQARPNVNLGEYLMVLPVVAAIALVGNWIGPGNTIVASLPGMLILLAITLVGVAITRYAPFYLPSVAWISLVGIIVTLPGFPGSEWILDHAKRVDFLALATPVLAYAGIAITRRELTTFRQSGWKMLGVAVIVFLGTYLFSAVIAHVTLKLQGVI